MICKNNCDDTDSILFFLYMRPNHELSEYHMLQLEHSLNHHDM